MNNLISASSNQEGLAERVDECFKILRRTYTQRAWPTPAHFVKAMGEIKAPSILAAPSDEQSASWEQKITADRMAKGDPVGDSWFYGRLAVSLINAGMVTPDVLRKYRSAYYFSAKKVYGKEKADRLEAAMIKRHEDAEAMMKPKASA